MALRSCEKNLKPPMNTDKRRLKLLALSVFICLNPGPNLTAADAPAGVKKPAAPAKSKAAATVAARKTSKPAPAAPVRSRSQMAPTKERYKQIQEALASKGYLAPAETTGQWTNASINALKRFQANQNLEANGKINSLSLIALGLGPKHEKPASRTQAP